jgi:hypothetical protein
MALLSLVPTSPGISIFQGEGQAINFTCNNSAGSPVTMSGLNAYRIKIFNPSGSGSASPMFSDTTTGNFTGSSGALLYTLSAAHATAMQPGSWSYVVECQNGSGDDFQQVAAGTVTVRVAA